MEKDAKIISEIKEKIKELVELKKEAEDKLRVCIGIQTEFESISLIIRESFSSKKNQRGCFASNLCLLMIFFAESTNIIASSTFPIMSFLPISPFGHNCIAIETI